MNSSHETSPDTAGQPDSWQVDGVSDAARQAAEEAAARDGHDLGVWLEAAIRDAASSGSVSTDDIVAAIDALGARIASAESTTRQAILPLRDRLGRLSQQLSEIEQERTADAGAEKPDDDEIK
jgi:hypothetical protein